MTEFKRPFTHYLIRKRKKPDKPKQTPSEISEILKKKFKEKTLENNVHREKSMGINRLTGDGLDLYNIVFDALYIDSNIAKRIYLF